MVLPSGYTAMVGCSLANLDLATLVTTHLLAFRWRTDVMGTMVDRSLDMVGNMVWKCNDIDYYIYHKLVITKQFSGF